MLSIYYRINTFKLGEKRHSDHFAHHFRKFEALLGNFTQNLGSIVVYTSLTPYTKWIGYQHWICYQRIEVEPRILPGGSTAVSRYCVPASFAPKEPGNECHKVLKGSACSCDLTLAAANLVSANGRDGRRLIEVAKACYRHQSEYGDRPKRAGESEVCDQCDLSFVGFRIDADGTVREG